MAYITIEYDESEDQTIPCKFCNGTGYEDDEVCEGCNGTGLMPAVAYEKVKLSTSWTEPKIEKIFESGNFIKDWFDAMKYFLLEMKEPSLLKSSSVDHFIMDGAPYDSAYLKNLENEGSLDYNYDFQNPGVEMFVPENTQPTWKELKEMCK